MSMYRVIKKLGHNSKTSTMKDIRNLAIKSEHFGEACYKSLTSEIKDKNFMLLALMLMNRSCDIKTRGCVNVSYERTHTDNSDFSSYAPHIYVFKCACVVIVKKNRDIATVNLPIFSQKWVDDRA